MTTKKGLSRTKSSLATKPHYGMYIGWVKDNTDADKCGRLLVWIPELYSDPENREGWVLVNYCSPFGGATNLLNNGSGSDKVKKFDETQVSYGFWAIPPDLENQVAVMFVNGDISRGIWFGCLFQQYMNHMVPASASGDNHQYPSEDLPVAEYNKKTAACVNPDEITRPYQKTLSEGLTKQGLVRDKVRGVTTSSARREAPSQVYGLSTPGPQIEGKEGKRQGGHQFVLDDGVGSEHIRLRTKSGAQMLLDETNGIVYFINKDGTSWMQMDEEGNVDVFGAKSFSVRAEENINFRADENIYMEAGKNIFMKSAGGDIQMHADNESGNANIHATAKSQMRFTTEEDDMYFLSAVDLRMTADRSMHTLTRSGSTNMQCEAGTLHVKTADGIIMNTDTSIDMKSGTTFNMQSGTEMNLKSTSNLNAQSTSVINLNGGTSVAVTGGASSMSLSASSAGLSGSTVNILSTTEVRMTGTAGVNVNSGGTIQIAGGGILLAPPPAGGAVPILAVSSSIAGSAGDAGEAEDAVNAEEATKPSENTKINIKFTEHKGGSSSEMLIFDKNTEEITTIVDRMITREPCPEHKNTGGQ